MTPVENMVTTTHGDILQCSSTEKMGSLLLELADAHYKTPPLACRDKSIRRQLSYSDAKYLVHVACSCSKCQELN